MTQDPCGRWYLFALGMDDVVLLEKKDLPTHLASLPCVDSPTQFRDLILQLEDAGEDRLLKKTHTPENLFGEMASGSTTLFSLQSLKTIIYRLQFFLILTRFSF